jgi:hypothetical protein
MVCALCDDSRRSVKNRGSHANSLAQRRSMHLGEDQHAILNAVFEYDNRIVKQVRRHAMNCHIGGRPTWVPAFAGYACLQVCARPGPMGQGGQTDLARMSRAFASATVLMPARIPRMKIYKKSPKEGSFEGSACGACELRSNSSECQRASNPQAVTRSA